MASVRWAATYAALISLAAFPAAAAGRVVRLSVPPPVQKGIAAFPAIADPADDAERQINGALSDLDSQVRQAAAGCNDPGGLPGWTRQVQVPTHGPVFLSYLINDDAFCGGAHPATSTMAIVYDLRTGKPVDWTKLLPSKLTGKVELLKAADGTRVVTLASARLYNLYLAGYSAPGGTAEDRASCKQAVRGGGSDGPPAMMVWLDSSRGGLAVQYDLSHVVQACAVPVVIPAAVLRSEGARPDLLDAITVPRRR